MTRHQGADTIKVIGASEHNLRNVDITLPRHALTVFTGVSGSGKSSLAFDTLFKEGQRRFMESLSPYARQFLGQMEKPRVEHVEGLSPTVSIDQKTVNRNPRSTVGTITELYDYLRLLMARLGRPYCPDCKVPISTLTPEQISDRVMLLASRTGATRRPSRAAADDSAAADAAADDGSDDAVESRASKRSSAAEASASSGCMVLAPIVRERKGEYRRELAEWLEQGYLRARIDGELRRLDEDITLARYEKHTIELVLDRFPLEPRNRSRLAEAVEKAIELAGGLVQVEVDGTAVLYSSTMACPQCQLPIPELEPRFFSFNDPQGACAACNGLGVLRRYTEERLTHPERSLSEGAFTCFTGRGNLVFTDIEVDFVRELAQTLGIDPQVPWGKLPAKQRRLMLEGNANFRLRVRNVFRNPRLLLEHARDTGEWPGLTAVLRFLERFVGTALDRYQAESACPECDGLRLNPVALAVRFREHNIAGLTGLTVEDAVRFFDTVQPDETEELIGKDIFREIRARLGFLNNVGVGYLSLDRRATTLSGGEAQRIRLASQVGSGLQGVLYILDEPSIGLHQTDNRKLIQTLQRLRDSGNTVVVVEHDEETIRTADHVVDLGPGAGSLGGAVLAQGTVEDLMANPNSLSGRYLAGSEQIAIPTQRRKPGKRCLSVQGARRHNLQDVSVSVPLGLFVAVTGVSGSGKSTLVHDILKPGLSAHLNRSADGGSANGDGRALTDRSVGDDNGRSPSGGKAYRRLTGLQHVDKVIEINQSPIGRTPRSNPATYTKVLDQIRALFCEVPEARVRGYKPGRFSFNVPRPSGGRCEACQGAGVRTIEMQFLSNVEVVCEECGGRRFNEETLQVHYKGQSIYDVLCMSVDEGAAFFAHVPKIARILETLQAVGLGYIHLGQPSTTLSGGEAQRVKLASELRKTATGRTLYLLDEPTTGLHFHDIRNLLECLNALVDQGNTVLVIEHNLDVIKVADWVIDLGPGGGRNGGQVVGVGTPEQLAALPDSLTGRVLAEVLEAGALKKAAPVQHSDSPSATPSAPRAESQAKSQGAALRAGSRDLIVRGAEQNNLRHVNVTIPRESLTVITGVSGSGKTSLAFDTIFAEGQARYVESLSTYARRFLGRMDKARVESMDGLAPAIAIDQRNSGRSPRSTVATVTEMYDYLRLLYARIGHAHCPHCGEPLQGYSPTSLAREIATAHEGERLILTAPLYRPGSTRPMLLDTAAHLEDVAPALLAEGYLRVRLNGAVVELPEWLEGPAAKRKLKAGTTVELVIDRMQVRARERKRLAEACEVAFEKGHGLVTLVYPDADTDAETDADRSAEGTQTPGETTVSRPPGCVACDYYQDEPFVPRMFSFNSHVGACTTCAGLGKAFQVDPALLVPFPEEPLLGGALAPGKLGQKLSRKHARPERAIVAFARREGIDLEQPFAALQPEQQHLLLHGDGRRLDFTKRRAFSRSHRVFSTTFRGLVGMVSDWYNSADRERWAPLVEPVMANVACPDCEGERLRPVYRAVTLGGRNISAFCALTVEEAVAELEAWPLSKTEKQVAEQPLQEIRARLGFLRDVGLGYLSLNRDAVTLSGGEAQRIRLASQLGAHLVGVLYVLDEPTIGLHPRDTGRLLKTLHRLRDLGNIVIVVEHDPETIRAADYVIDIGPGAGHLGGEVVAAGTPAQVARNKASLTGDYMSGRRTIPMPAALRPIDPKRVLRVRGARANNLKRVDADFPLGAFTAVTGVSGSGKSSLVVSVLQQALARHLDGARVVPGAHDSLEGLEHVDKLVVIDQSPIGKTPKSNPATYTGVMDKIRALMAKMPEANMRGYKAGRFSFNVKGGRCEACEGRGYNHIEMHFLADVWVPCDACAGKRYNRETLEVRFRGRNMADLLEMEIAKAAALFANQPGICRGLQTLVDVGLGYMKLGQAGHTLSGGEAQRVKLATELSRPRTGRTVYTLDEPTTGLHLDDVAKLLCVLHRLVDEGNTVIVIEHNLDVIKTADHVLDLGPEGGDAGGEMVALGTPAELAAQPHSHTGRALAEAFPELLSRRIPATPLLPPAPARPAPESAAGGSAPRTARPATRSAGRTKPTPKPGSKRRKP